MIEDILKKLRMQQELGLMGVPDGEKWVHSGEAADEIEKLRAENELLSDFNKGNDQERYYAQERERKLKEENDELKKANEELSQFKENYHDMNEIDEIL